MDKKNYKRLSLRERIIIETLLKEKRKKTFIAKQLSRSRSTISREINKWVKKPNDVYKAELAHWYAVDDNNTKRYYDKITQYSKLKMYVYRGLLKGWSPEQISGRIKLDFPNDDVMSISYESIYKHIYTHPQGQINKKLIALLPYHKSRRRSIKKRNKRMGRIKEAVSIDFRPQHVEDRQEIGHWEGDLIIGVKQLSAIATIVERKIRYTYIIKLKDRKSRTVRKGLAKELNQLNSNFRKTFTYDNGLEMAEHKELTKQTGMRVYFAHPYSAWERGTNENTNGLIRRYFPKGTNFNKVTEAQLKVVQDKLNNRPRKILGYKTPDELMVLEHI
jgi:IS30 family transposase